MSQENLNNKIVSATKWSSITELAAKLVSPVSTMILARLLTPEAFGVLVMATMVISFAEIFTDAGFQKYLIQHKFDSDEDKYKSTTVAFWSNFILSMLIWIGIIIFADKLAILVGNEGYGNVIAVSCICIPLAAFSSIQMALYKRSLDFKTLFWIRIIGIMIPLVITVPLAYLTHSYWSLIIGMIVLNCSNALLLTIKSPWKPNLYFSFQRFKDMFSFSIWTMIDAISVWFTSYIDIFIVGMYLNQHYMGIYRTATTTVGQIMSIITAVTAPIMLSALSKLQDDDEMFKRLFFKFQKILGLLVIPLGVGIFIFRDFITNILLGSQWGEATWFIGIWALMGTFTIVFSHVSSSVYIAKGKPKINFFNQIIHIAFLVPLVLWAIKYDFQFLCTVRSLLRLELVLTNILFLYFLIGISPLAMVKNIFPSILASICMFIPFIFLSTQNNLLMNILYLFLAITIYFLVIIFFKEERWIIFNFKKIIKQ